MLHDKDIDIRHRDVLICRTHQQVMPYDTDMKALSIIVACLESRFVSQNARVISISHSMGIEATMLQIFHHTARVTHPSDTYITSYTMIIIVN